MSGVCKDCGHQECMCEPTAFCNSGIADKEDRMSPNKEEQLLIRISDLQDIIKKQSDLLEKLTDDFNDSDFASAIQRLYDYRMEKNT
jgi:hypothetical protein